MVPFHFFPALAIAGGKINFPACRLKNNRKETEPVPAAPGRIFSATDGGVTHNFPARTKKPLNPGAGQDHAFTKARWSSPCFYATYNKH